MVGLEVNGNRAVSTLVIRTHKRFAVRRQARLSGDGERPQDVLLIEISLEGCRISNVDAGAFRAGQVATVEIDGLAGIEAQVRWAHDGLVGLRFLRPLHLRALYHLIGACRAGPDSPVRLAACGS